MICRNCKKEVANGLKFCPHCGAEVNGQPQQPVTPPYAQNTYNQSGNYVPPAQPLINQTPYMVWAILATLFCCLPLGIPAIVYATKIGSSLAVGNYQLAQDSAKKSKIFTIVSACIGGGVALIYAIMLAIAGSSLMYI